MSLAQLVGILGRRRSRHRLLLRQEPELMRWALIALSLLMLSCAGKAAPPTLNLGGVTMREDAYRDALRRLVRSDDEVCRTWLREGTEPVTAMANKTTAGANAKDLVKAMALFSQECFAR